MSDASERAEICFSCRFWQADEDQAHPFGNCRRHAPQAMHGGRGVTFGQTPALWPRTDATDWCGEHQVAPPARLPAPEGWASLDNVR